MENIKRLFLGIVGDGDEDINLVGHSKLLNKLNEPVMDIFEPKIKRIRLRVRSILDDKYLKPQRYLLGHYQSR